MQRGQEWVAATCTQATRNDDLAAGAYAAPCATDAEIRAALARTKLNDLLQRLPDGLDTLSAPQRHTVRQ